MIMTIMVPMTIKITGVKSMTAVVMMNGMPTTGNLRPAPHRHHGACRCAGTNRPGDD